MKRTSRVLAILLALAMLLSVTAFAAWDVYGGNDKHNSVVANAPTSITSATSIDLSNGGRGWDGVDNVPVMETVGTGDDAVTYAYVLYDGYSSYGGQLAKINCSAATPYVVWRKQVSGASGFQLSTPYLDTEARAIYIGASYASVYNDVAIANPVSLTSGTAGTVTIDGLSLLTASNRVAAPVYVGHTSVADRGTITTEGTATIRLGGGTAVNLTLSTTQSSSGTIYKIYEQATYDDDGEVNGYDYYYYINHSVTASSTENATLSISVTLNGTGTIESVSMFANKGAVTKVTGIDSTDASGVTLTAVVSAVDGQINTPITRYGDFIYFGTWSGSTPKQYYQVDVSGTDFGAVTYTGKAGFYWAGAASVTIGTGDDAVDYIYFGGDSGYLYYQSAGEFGEADNYVELTEKADDAGNVRSTIMTDGTNLYFTSQGKYLWCYQPDANGVPVYQWHVQLAGTSTSTPTLVQNSDGTTSIYTGYYSGFSAGGVQVTTYANGATPTSSDVTTVVSGFPVQCSVLYSNGYIYFNTNASNGAGYCFNAATGAQVWTTTADTYALGGMACDNGIIVFGNDYDHLYVVK